MHLKTMANNQLNLALKKSLQHIQNEKKFLKRINEIHNLSKQIDFNNLTYCFKDKSAPKDSIGFKVSLDFYENIKKGSITLKKSRRKTN